MRHSIKSTHKIPLRTAMGRQPEMSHDNFDNRRSAERVPMIKHAWFACAALLCFCATNAAPVFAQELLWSTLPEDGSWVRFHGTVKDTQERPESNEGALELTWPTE